MKRVLIILAVFIFAIVIVQESDAQTLALSNILNTAQITAANIYSTTIEDSTNITVATMYGGRLSITVASQLSITSGSRVKWVLTLSNVGNAIAAFQTKIAATNGVNNGTWIAYISNAGVLDAFDSPVSFDLAPGSFSNIGLVISNSPAGPATNASYFSILVKASNQSADIDSHFYQAQGGTTWYGGTIGLGTNASETNNVGGSSIGPVMYLQHEAGLASAGYLTALISAPVLSIVKTVESVQDMSGLGTSLVEARPGALITYRIYVTNSGSAPAYNSEIWDSINTNFVEYIGTTDNTNYGLQGLVGSQLIFTNAPPVAAGLPANTRGVVRVKVRVK